MPSLLLMTTGRGAFHNDRDTGQGSALLTRHFAGHGLLLRQGSRTESNNPISAMSTLVFMDEVYRVLVDWGEMDEAFGAEQGGKRAGVQRRYRRGNAPYQGLEAALRTVLTSLEPVTHLRGGPQGQATMGEFVTLPDNPIPNFRVLQPHVTSYR